MRVREQDSEAHMWDYWRDKKGYVEALKSQYPIKCQKDPIISLALAQMESARMVVDRRMEQLAQIEIGEKDEQ